jgi:PAS domain S-box-containing protein
VAIFIRRTDNGRYVYWNASSERLFGIPASQVIGKTDEELFSPDMVATIRKENIELFLNRSEVKNKIISNKHLGGKLIHMIIVPVFDSNGTPQYVLGISEDVSPQNINLKMDLLFSITRQDVMNNLEVIMNHLERAQLLNSPEEIQQFFAKTLRSIETIHNQIAYTRGLQELGLVSPKWQNIGRAFTDAARLLPDCHADIRADVGDAEIFADPLLPRVFFTLLENSCGNQGRGQSRVTLSLATDTNDLLVIYTDDGFWIPADEKERIFDIGYDGRLIRGMFMIRELLGLTGITIRETGDEGAGIRFEIRIPAGKYRFTE